MRPCADASRADAELAAPKIQLIRAQELERESEATFTEVLGVAGSKVAINADSLLGTPQTSYASQSAVTDHPSAQVAEAQQDNVNAAQQALQSIAQTEAYLQVKAPFDGVVTERNVHPGALVGPAGAPGVAVPMLRIETLSRLRVVVPVPETYAAGVPEGTKVEFTVPAFPGRSFSGTIARIAHSVDEKTRTMPVELEAGNTKGELSPGTFSGVLWPVRRSYPTLFVPTSSVANTLEQVFVVRIRANKSEWVDVKTGATAAKMTEVFGDLNEGDIVAVRGTDELRPGSSVSAQQDSEK